jgi:hypothetical protein
VKCAECGDPVYTAISSVFRGLANEDGTPHRLTCAQADRKPRNRVARKITDHLDECRNGHYGPCQVVFDRLGQVHTCARCQARSYRPHRLTKTAGPQQERLL